MKTSPSVEQKGISNTQISYTEWGTVCCALQQWENTEQTLTITIQQKGTPQSYYSRGKHCEIKHMGHFNTFRLPAVLVAQDRGLITVFTGWKAFGQNGQDMALSSCVYVCVHTTFWGFQRLYSS